jgi:hypothetical protein
VVVARIRLRPKAGFSGQVERSEMRVSFTGLRGFPGFCHSASKTRVNALKAHPGYSLFDIVRQGVAFWPNRANGQKCRNFKRHANIE